MLYTIAKKQSLVGICFAGVQRLQEQQQCPPEKLYLQWMGMAAKIQQKNEVLNRQCAELQAKLFDCGMRSTILKGQGIASLYAIKDEGLNINDLSGLRQSGDIDVYVDCGREMALEYARSMQYQVDWDYKHLHLKMFKDTEVEVHYRPEVLMNLRKNARLQRWFEEHKEMMFRASTCSGIRTGELVVPSVEFNLFYILLHIYRHFLFEGVGMRQLMDYYFVLSAYAEHESPRITQILSINTLLKDFGMERFASGVMWIMNHVFGMSGQLLLVEPDEKEGRYILGKVMAGGNFGHHDKRLKDKKTTGKKRAIKKILKHNLHLLTHYPADTLWAPVWIVYHWCWKRMNRRQTNKYRI